MKFTWIGTDINRLINNIYTLLELSLINNSDCLPHSPSFPPRGLLKFLRESSSVASGRIAPGDVAWGEITQDVMQPRPLRSRMMCSSERLAPKRYTLGRFSVGRCSLLSTTVSAGLWAPRSRVDDFHLPPPPPPLPPPQAPPTESPGRSHRTSGPISVQLAG